MFTFDLEKLFSVFFVRHVVVLDETYLPPTLLIRIFLRPYRSLVTASTRFSHKERGTGPNSKRSLFLDLL